MNDASELDERADKTRVEVAAVDAARALCPVGQEMIELDTADMPRWFAPLGSAKTRYCGLGVRPAIRWRSRAYRAALRAWVLTGGARLTHRVVRKDEGEWELGTFLRPYMPTLATAAVSVGTPGPDQKVTARLMDRNGRTLGFAKYATTFRARTLLANEKRMLELIPPGVGPAPVCFAPFLMGTLLVQAPLPGSVRAPRLGLDTALLRFLSRLESSGAAHEASQHPFMLDLYAKSAGHEDLLDAITAELGIVEWPVVFAHGDLSPWNTHGWQGECLAFDWEYGRELGFPYLDAAHNLIQVASLVKHLEPRQARRMVSDALRARLPVRHRSYASALSALAALNMLASWYPPREPDAYGRWLNDFARAQS